MNLVYAAGFLIIGLMFIIIDGQLVLKYMNNNNILSLYLIVFFTSAGIGWITLFFTLIFGIENIVFQIAFLVSVISILILFLFSSKVLELKKWVNITVTLGVILITVVHYIIPQYHLFTILATIITLMTVWLFLLIFRRRSDYKSLGMGIGLFLILVGESIQHFSETTKTIAGFIMILSALTFGFGFFGVLEIIGRKLTKESA
ncbi:MAG: hypothetical protein K9W44_13925 [Candidatus Lokiarchaeota archaeon]|nr:hypothetical protein [Candidatus Harpocratesius repetitus]